MQCPAPRTPGCVLKVFLSTCPTGTSSRNVPTFSTITHAFCIKLYGLNLRLSTSMYNIFTKKYSIFPGLGHLNLYLGNKMFSHTICAWEWCIYIRESVTMDTHGSTFEFEYLTIFISTLNNYLNSPPQDGGSNGWICSLSRRNWKVDVGRPLVNISATWSLEDINWTWSSLRATLSRTKWKSISTCFVRAWNTGLADKYVAPRLSHHKIRGCEKVIPSSNNRDCSQESSAEASARALYSDYMEESATVCCFREDHDIRFEPK